MQRNESRARRRSGDGVWSGEHAAQCYCVVIEEEREVTKVGKAR